MIECTQCLLDERYPGIRFNKQGICSECLRFNTTWETQISNLNYLKRTEAKLEHILKKEKNKNRKYDCAVASCGGTDSLYVLYLIKSVYGLNPLVITIDNGFLTPQPKRNQDILLEKLGIESVYYKPRILEGLSRHFLTHAGNFCVPCVYLILFHVGRIALEHKVRLLIFGMSRREDAVLPYQTTPINFLKIISSYNNKNHLSELKQIKKLWPIILTYYCTIGKVINFPDYLRWDKEYIKKVLKEKFSIELGEEHSDCDMHEFANYLAYKKYGFSLLTIKYSKMIRNRKITREEALMRIKKEEGIKPYDLKRYMDYFRITERDIEQAKERSKILYLGFLNRIGQCCRRIYFRRGI